MPWLGMKEAAEALGVSVDTIRRRLKAGELEGKQEPMSGSGAGFRWLIEVPEPEPVTPAASTSPGVSVDAIELADAKARLEGLERVIDELQRARDEAARQALEWQEAAKRSDEARARSDEAARDARIMLSHSMAQLPAELAPIDAREHAGGSHQVQSPPESSETPPHGFWGRFLRAMRGGNQ